MARPDIESRTSDLRVRCPTDCATRPGVCTERKRETFEQMFNELPSHIVRLSNINGSDKNTTQNSLRVTFTRSCQHFLPKRILKFLLYQSRKLIQKCCLQVLSSFLFSPFSKHGSGLFGGHILHCTMFVLQVPSFFFHSLLTIIFDTVLSCILPLHLRLL